jgi:hypothetical protein
MNDWALAVIAAALVAFAAVSARLRHSSITPAIVFVGIGLAAGIEGLGLGGLGPVERSRANAGRGDANPHPLCRRVPDRPSGAGARVFGVCQRREHAPREISTVAPRTDGRRYAAVAVP